MSKTTQQTITNYRPEIDGLRAVAVLAVVLFHFHVPILPGGLLGVDVFFVISGYLITQLLLTAIDNKDFSIAGFYERRARRILPALFVVTVFTSVGAFLIFSSYDFHAYSNSLSSLSIFSSNFFFWKSTRGYFGADAQEMPLLHTWSLSVEEQFYLIYPLIVAGARKFLSPRFFKALLVFLFIVSLGAYSWMVQRDGNEAFYNSLYRFWELLAGGMIAAGVVRLKRTNRLPAVVSAVGIGLILFSFMGWGSGPFNFLFSIMAVAGAACILLVTANHKNPVAFLLGTRPFVFLGKISYSLYLWHWPLIVYAGLLSLRPLTFMGNAIIGVVSLLLAFLSYRYIEQPFRRPHAVLKSRRAVLCAALLVLLVTGVGGLVLSDYKGFEKRSAADRMLAEVLKEKFWLKMLKHNNVVAKDSASSVAVRIGDTSAVPAVAIWGDSHAQVLAAGFDSVNRSPGNNAGYVCCYPSMAPLLGVKKNGDSSRFVMNNRVFHFISQHEEIKTVVLNARWLTYFLDRSNQRFNTSREALAYEQADSANSKGLQSKKMFRAALRFTIDELTRLKKKVIIVGPVPEIPMPFNNLMIHARFYKRSLNDFAGDTATFENHSRELATFFRSLASDNVSVFFPAPVFHNGNRFAIEQDGHLLYRDGNHLSQIGAFEVARRLQTLIGRH